MIGFVITFLIGIAIGKNPLVAILYAIFNPIVLPITIVVGAIQLATAGNHIRGSGKW